MSTLRNRLRLSFRRIMIFLAILGPGLITASGDNDAPGIATYSIAGSYYGYDMLWGILLITLGEVVIQEMAARMGAVTTKGLADLIRERYGVKITFFAILCLLLANLGTTVAQFAGIAASTELLGISRYITVPLGAIFVWVLVVRGSYGRVEKVLLGLTLYAIAYIITVFLVQPDWGMVVRRTLVPTVHLRSDYLLTLLAIIGTTITPWGAVYMQASVADKGVRPEQYSYTRMDVMTGAILGNVVAAFIVICTAATLFPHGIRVDTAEEAAIALVPLAGPWARYLFGIGLLGASLLAASVLPLSTTYAVCEAFEPREVLAYDDHPRRTRAIEDGDRVACDLEDAAVLPLREGEGARAPVGQALESAVHRKQLGVGPPQGPPVAGDPLRGPPDAFEEKGDGGEGDDQEGVDRTAVRPEGRPEAAAGGRCGRRNARGKSPQGPGTPRRDRPRAGFRDPCAAAAPPSPGREGRGRSWRTSRSRPRRGAARRERSRRLLPRRGDAGTAAQRPQSGVKKGHGRNAEQMIELDEIVKRSQQGAPGAGIDPHPARRDADHRHDAPLFVEQVGEEGGRAPEGETQGRELDPPPARLARKPPPPEAHPEHPHGEEKKKMRPLMDEDPLGRPVLLHGVGRLFPEHQRQREERGRPPPPGRTQEAAEHRVPHPQHGRVQEPPPRPAPSRDRTPGRGRIRRSRASRTRAPT